MLDTKSILENYELGIPHSMNSLTIYPIFSLREADVQLSDIDEAIENGWIEVTEVSESGSVPELKVTNRSHETVIIFDGEELVGAKQNRMVNVTIVIAPKSSLFIPVSCVEQGRWSRKTRSFGAGEFAYSSLRRDKFQRVTENLKMKIGHVADQGMVWDAIAAKSARLGVRSDTGAMQDVEHRYHIDDESLRRTIPHKDCQVGYLAFVRDGFAGGDIFPSTQISERKFYKLMRSYNLDSLDTVVEFPGLDPLEVLAQIKSSLVEKVDSVGAGEDHRFDGPSVQGSITLVNGKFGHLTVFPKVKQTRQQGRMRRRYWVD